MNAMVQTLNTAGRAFVEFAVPMLLQSSLLILILLAVDAVLRKRVRAVFRYWIWMLVLVKLVLPPSLWSPVSVGTWFGERLEVSTAVLLKPPEPPSVESRPAEPSPFVTNILRRPQRTFVEPPRPEPRGPAAPGWSGSQTRRVAFGDPDSTTPRAGVPQAPSPVPAFPELAGPRIAGLGRRCSGLAALARPADVLRAGSRCPSRRGQPSRAPRIGPVPTTHGPAATDLPAAFPKRGQSGRLRAMAADNPGPAESRRTLARGRPASRAVPRTGPRPAGRPVDQPRPNAPANRLLLQSSALAGERGHPPHSRESGR